MVKESDNQLVGQCPICTAPSADSTANDAYVASTINDSDKDVYLEWSVYYEEYVCHLCNEDGKNFIVDEIRDNDDREKEKSRQKMGFKHTYTTNTI